MAGGRDRRVLRDIPHTLVAVFEATLVLLGALVVILIVFGR